MLYCLQCLAASRSSPKGMTTAEEPPSFLIQTPFYFSKHSLPTSASSFHALLYSIFSSSCQGYRSMDNAGWVQGLLIQHQQYITTVHNIYTVWNEQVCVQDQECKQELSNHKQEASGSTFRGSKDSLFKSSSTGSHSLQSGTPVAAVTSHHSSQLPPGHDYRTRQSGQ